MVVVRRRGRRRRRQRECCLLRVVARYLLVVGYAGQIEMIDLYPSPLQYRTYFKDSEIWKHTLIEQKIAWRCDEADLIHAPILALLQAKHL